MKTQEDVNKTVKKLNAKFRDDLKSCLNFHGIDSQIGVADWILADHLIFTLMNFEATSLKIEMNNEGYGEEKTPDQK